MAKIATSEQARATVAWDALFGPDGASRVAGAMVAETAREAAAEAS
jgi:hypothetical protein